MRLANIFLTLFMLFFFCGSIICEEREDYLKPHPGMQETKIGDARVVTPQGAKIYKIGDLQVLEGAGEYTARRLLAMEERLDKIENENLNLRKELDALKEEISNMKKGQVLVK